MSESIRFRLWLLLPWAIVALFVANSWRAEIQTQREMERRRPIIEYMRIHLNQTFPDRWTYTNQLEYCEKHGLPKPDKPNNPPVLQEAEL